MSESVTTRVGSPFRRNWVWSTIQILLRPFFFFWIRSRARGFEHLPVDGGALFLVNHQSFLDPLLVGACLRRPVSYLARENLFRVPFVGWVLRNTYVVPMRRSAASTESLREAIARMEAGFYVGIFPEGTRRSDGQLGPLKPGLLALVRRVGVPVIPVGIAGAQHVMPRGAILPRPKSVRIVFGPPLPAEELAQLIAPGREQELLQLASEKMGACMAEAESWRRGCEV
ncbi:MAG: lysophospholipid acyltransferase family protein [Planctomycetaceae bacterium]